jgi:formate dehydrogenase subunit gamma
VTGRETGARRRARRAPQQEPTMSKNLIERYTFRERVAHWLVAFTFLLLALSGLSVFHPLFYPLSTLFGGGPWVRILHPFLGVVLAIAYIDLARRFWHANRIAPEDREWFGHLKDMLANRTVRLAETGKYNIAQKYYFWTLTGAVAVLVVTGLAVWQPYFAPLLPVGVVRLAVLLHSIAGFVAVVAMIVHVYAAYWVRGSIPAMTRGTVTEAWARHHHPGWYKELTKGTR